MLYYYFLCVFFNTEMFLSTMCAYKLNNVRNETMFVLLSIKLSSYFQPVLIYYDNQAVVKQQSKIPMGLLINCCNWLHL